MAFRARSTPTIRIALALAAASFPLAAACSVALDFTGIDDGVRDGSISSDATGGADAPLSEAGKPLTDGQAATDADADGQLDAHLDGDAPRDGGADVPIVPIVVPCVTIDPSFCIDSVEVTVDQYTRFLQFKAGEVTGQPSSCSWNTSFVPAGWPEVPGNAPVTGTNWCMAYTFCEWAGKRLCGAPDAGAADPNRWGESSQSQWFKACSRNNDGLHTYPYGNTYDPTACNGTDFDAGKALPSLASCEGPYSGLFDMSGNVLEWEDSCLVPDGGTPGAGDFCHTRGGAFGDNAGGLQCNAGVLFTRGSMAGNVGFRCCSK